MAQGGKGPSLPGIPNLERQEMTTEAIIFMVVIWTALLSLVTWSYSRVLRGRRHFDPDGIGPASPPVPTPAAEERRPRRR